MTSIQYIQEGLNFSFNYQELLLEYNKFVNYSDEEFIENIAHAIHFAIFVCYIKGLKSYNVLSDTGIIHELSHLQLGIQVTKLPEIREQFNKILKLSP